MLHVLRINFVFFTEIFKKHIATVVKVFSD